MRALRLHEDGLRVEEIELPEPGPGEVLVRVHAAAITRDELTWPTDRLPAIPSYELSGVVVDGGDEVVALTPFDRDGVAAEYAVVPTAVLAPKPPELTYVEAAALPMGALSAQQGLAFLRGICAGRPPAGRAGPRHRDSDLGERTTCAGRLPLGRAERGLHAVLPLRAQLAGRPDRRDHRVRHPRGVRALRSARVDRRMRLTLSRPRRRVPAAIASACSRPGQARGPWPKGSCVAARSSTTVRPARSRRVAVTGGLCSSGSVNAWPTSFSLRSGSNATSHP
jgi:hypothetical protein